MIEQLRERRYLLIAAKMKHVRDNQKYQPQDSPYDPDFPAFADADDLAYYHRLRGRIEECTYLMALCMAKKNGPYVEPSGTVEGQTS